MAVAVGSTLGASQLLFACFGFDQLTGGADTDGGASDGADGAANDAALSDVGADTSSNDGGADSAPTCPTGRGPAMIRTDAGCIDTTEVTQAQYAAFLASTPPAQPSACAGNDSFVPGQVTGGFACSANLYDPSGRPNSPVRCVDWCDAFVFCAWAGKRLCGAIGGGAVAVADSTDPTKSEWMHACTAGGSHDYPYGVAFTPGACWGADDFDGGNDLPPVGSAASCIGGYPGIFDMSGSVSEWENSCTGTDPAESCLLRGGSVTDTSSGLICGTPGTHDYGGRSGQGGAIGFRCCAP